MSDFPPCPSCADEYTYPDQNNYVCPSCGHEWPQSGEAQEEGPQFRDANGTPLQDGDTVTLIKDLKLKGSSQVLKVGTKVTNIRLVEGDHDIDCKINGQKMMLKSCFVKKA
ncbi:MAG: zinc ribbon domain-containing protein YjdM [Venatoribacter sp.]